MASRAELVEMCKELEIDYSGMSTEEMDKEVREQVDKKLDISSIKIGNKGLSDTLLYFISEEYDYIFKDKDGNLVDYKGDKL